MNRERLIQRADEFGDFLRGDDGYYVYWPRVAGGALDATSLRILADELDARNENWDAEIRADQKLSEK